MALCFLSKRDSKRESASDKGVTVFCNIITEETSHHFCYILSLEKQETRSSPLPGEGNTQRQQKKTGVIGAKSEVACHKHGASILFSASDWEASRELWHQYHIYFQGQIQLVGVLICGHWMWSSLRIKLPDKCWAGLTWAPEDPGNRFSGMAEGSAPVWGHRTEWR